MVAASVVNELRSDGFASLRPGFDPQAANRLSSLIWRELAASGVKESDPTTWPRGRQGKAATKGLHDHRAFASFWSRDLATALDALFGAGQWARPAHAGSILMTFPEPAGPPRRLDGFHSDFAMDIPGEPLFAVAIFAFLGAVAPRSGGTLVLRNSHRVVERYLDALPAGFPRNRAARQFRVDHPWLSTLDTVGATHHSDGIEVTVEELTGEPGDLVITHPWTLHAGASNHGSAPRMMLRHHIFRSA